MVKAEAEVLIARPTSRVFEIVAVEFVRNYPRWSCEVEYLEALSDGPIHVGWMGRQVRVDKGRRTRSDFRVVALERERQLSFQGVDQPFRIDYGFEAVEGQTRLRFRFELEQLSLGLRPFIGMVRRAAQESADRMMIQMKSLIEDEIDPADGGAAGPLPRS